MDSFISLQIGGIADSSPSWFDWLSLAVNLVVSVVSIWGGFKIAKYIFLKEQKKNEHDEKKIQDFQSKLFKVSLTQLNKSVEEQINNLKKYKQDGITLTTGQGVNSGFLEFIDIRYLYQDIGINNQTKIEEANKLLSALYAINDVRSELKEEARSFLQKYWFHEEKFYSYRKLLYTKHHELCNKRAVKMRKVNSMTELAFGDNDKFMPRYSDLVNETFKDSQIVTKKGLDRKNLVERFIHPLIHLADDFIPDDVDAIEIGDIANVVHAAWIDMNRVESNHFEIIESYIVVLQDIRDKSKPFL